MELPKKCKITSKRSQSRFEEGCIFGILDFSKIISGKYFMENKNYQEILIFGAFLAYKILNNIAPDIEIRKEEGLRLIWPF